jgi:hypothetical protein
MDQLESKDPWENKVYKVCVENGVQLETLVFEAQKAPRVLKVIQDVQDNEVSWDYVAIV